MEKVATPGDLLPEGFEAAEGFGRLELDSFGNSISAKNLQDVFDRQAQVHRRVRIFNWSVGGGGEVYCCVYGSL